jgi:hypothetical protein
MRKGTFKGGLKWYFSPRYFLSISTAGLMLI